MRYSLKFNPVTVAPFLRNYQGLSREGRVRLYAQLHFALGHSGDTIRQDPNLREAPGSTYFWYRFLFRDSHGDGRIRQFTFAVSDAAAVYGVLEIQYVEVSEGP